MQVRMLGALEAASGDDLFPIRGQKQRVVLTMLALRLGEVVPTEVLIEAGWGDDLPADPANALQYQVARLRKAIEPDTSRPKHLLTSGPGYRLDPDTVDTDIGNFRTLMSAARLSFEADDLSAAASTVDAALRWWRGPALADFQYHDFAQGDSEQLESERVAAVELQADIALVDGRHGEAATILAPLTRENPLREDLWSKLALALYRSGRQSEALRVLHTARDALIDIGLEPGTELRKVGQQIVDQDASLVRGPSTARSTPHNLPAPPNRLIGRDTEVQLARELLEAGRLVTLLGPGGAGKTRLAIAVGLTLLDRYAGGVWLVSLENLDDGALVGAEVGRITSMREDTEQSVLDTLAQHLGVEPVLLIMDNCEHLVEPVASIVQQLTAMCPQLSVLATSQTTLDVVGEAIFTVAPLAVPGRTASIFDPISEVNAVALFLDRARSAGGITKRWSDEDISTIANIVAALDGLPLAIELAAARTRSMSLEEIAQGLEDRFEVLTSGPRTAPARQRSLRGALDWSLGLLSDSERELMAMLSVFSGSFGAIDVEAITGESLSRVRDDLALLVDRSLLTRGPDVVGAASFHMLESLRQHGLAKLDSEGLRSARDSHLAHFTRLAGLTYTGFQGPEQMNWLHRIDASYDNIRAGLAWSLDGGSRSVGLELATQIRWYWEWRGLIKEGSAWTGRLASDDQGVAPGLASILAWRAFIAWEIGDAEESKRIIEHASSIATELNNPIESAAVLSTQALISRSAGDLDLARSLSLTIIDVAERAGELWYVGWAESALATIALAAEDLDQAESHALRSVSLFRELGDRRGESWGLISIAQIALGRGDLEAARLHSRVALDAANSTEDDRNVLWTLEVLAETAHRQGDTETSARLWGASHPLRETRGLTGSVSKQRQTTEFLAALSDELGERFDHLVESGRLDPRAVIAEEVAALATSPEVGNE